MSRQDYIIAKLNDTQVEVRPSVSVQEALKDSMAALKRGERLAASYGELSESLRQRVELVMGFFLAFGEPVDARAKKALQTKVPPDVAEAPEDSGGDDVSIFGMGRS